LEGRHITLSVNGDFKYRNESVTTRIFQSFVHRDRMEVDWATGSSANV